MTNLTHSHDKIVTYDIFSISPIKQHYNDKIVAKKKDTEKGILSVSSPTDNNSLNDTI